MMKQLLIGVEFEKGNAAVPLYVCGDRDRLDMLHISRRADETGEPTLTTTAFCKAFGRNLEKFQPTAGSEWLTV